MWEVNYKSTSAWIVECGNRVFETAELEDAEWLAGILNPEQPEPCDGCRYDKASGCTNPDASRPEFWSEDYWCFKSA